MRVLLKIMECKHLNIGVKRGLNKEATLVVVQRHSLPLNNQGGKKMKIEKIRNEKCHECGRLKEEKRKCVVCGAYCATHVMVFKEINNGIPICKGGMQTLKADIEEALKED